MIALIRPANVSTRSAYSVPTTPPLGVAYLAASLRQAGFPVAVIDAVGEAPLQRGATRHPDLIAHGLSHAEIVARLPAETTGIGVSSMFSQDWPHTRGLVEAIRERFPRVPLCVGGEHATAGWEYVLRTCPGVTCCALGEGEATVVDFAQFAAGERTLDEIPGLAWRRDGVPVSNPRRARLTALDDLPWPAWDLVPLENYFAGGHGHGVNLGRSMPLLATRGCPFRCTFCSNASMWQSRYHVRAVDRVVSEIADYRARYQATNFDFYDLTAIVRRDWIIEFCQALEARGLRITWQLPSGTRSEALDAETLGWLARTGCRNITYAPESGSERTLKRIHKQVKLPRMLDSIRAARRAGLRVKCNVVIGFPDETRGDVWRSIALALRLALLGVDDTGVYLFSPYPGSELYDQLRAAGTLAEMSDEYCASLACFTDLGTASRYCRRISPRELNVLRLAGMGGFYGLSFLVRPWRALRVLWNVARGRSATILEQRLCEAKHRWQTRQRRESPGSASVTTRAGELPTLAAGCTNGAVTATRFEESGSQSQTCPV